MASANDLLTDGSRSKGGDLERTTTPTTNGPLLLKDDQEIDARCCDIAEGQGDSSWQAFRSYVGYFL